jgi:hypothetical protein
VKPPLPKEDAEAALAASKADLDQALRAQAAAAAAKTDMWHSPLRGSEENIAQTKSAASDNPIQENEEEISEIVPPTTLASNVASTHCGVANSGNAVVDAIVDNHDDGEEMIIFTSDKLPSTSAHQSSLTDEAWSFFCADDDYATVVAQAAPVTASADDLSFPSEKQARAKKDSQRRMKCEALAAKARSPEETKLLLKNRRDRRRVHRANLSNENRELIRKKDSLAQNANRVARCRGEELGPACPTLSTVGGHFVDGLKRNSVAVLFARQTKVL